MNRQFQRVGVFNRPGPPKKLKFEPISFPGYDVPEVAVPVVEPIVVTPPKPVEITEVGEGYISGKITVVSEAEPRNSRRYFNGVCQCAPGVETPVCVRIDHLRDKTTTSCGCERDEKLWFGTKARAKLKARLGQVSDGPDSGVDSVTTVDTTDSTPDGTSPPEGSKAPIQVGQPSDEYFVPSVCPHLDFPVSPPVEGRVWGVSLECYRCHDIYEMPQLIKAWSHTLDLKLDTPSRRMERAGSGFTGEYLIKVGRGTDLEIVAENNPEAERWMEFDPSDPTDDGSIRRKPAKPTRPSGVGPDSDDGPEE